MNKLKKLLASAAGTMLVFGVIGVAGATSAAAAECTPFGTFVGDIKVTVCVAPDLPPAGYPSAGAYAAPHGYVQVCRGTDCSLTVPFEDGATGAAVVLTQVGPLVPTKGTSIPNTCIGTSTCTPSNLPGFQVTLFGDPALLIIKINGNETRLDAPTVCVSTAGTC